MSNTDTSTRTAETSAPILDVLAERWSPRAYDVESTVDEQALTASLEAARWSPSASNSQPWRFIVGRRGTPEFEAILNGLMGFNQAWAPNAGVLIVGVVDTLNAEGKPQRWAEYDLGQAVAHFSVQAHAEGLHVHQMGGFVPATIVESFGLEEQLVPVIVFAVGTVASPDILADKAREREIAPRTRRPLAESLITKLP